MKLTISLGQMDVRLGDPAGNLRTVAAMTAEAARRGSDVVVFPELWSTGYDLENAAAYATPTDTGIFAAVANLAREHGVAILGSCLALLGPGQIGNTALFVGPQGQVWGEYSKMHLFRLMAEEQYLTAGSRPGLIPTPWGCPAGVAICYDLRFPELLRQYALQGARLLFLPAEWPHPRLTHWQTLLRARAIENQMFVVGCNRVGSSKGSTFCGHSAVVDPWGELVIEGDERPGLLTATIDTALADEVRARIPVFADRRPELYAPAAGGQDGVD